MNFYVDGYCVEGKKEAVRLEKVLCVCVCVCVCGCVWVCECVGAGCET